MSRVIYYLGCALILVSLPLAMLVKLPVLLFSLAVLGQLMVVTAFRWHWLKRLVKRRVKGERYGRRGRHGRRQLEFHLH